MKNIIDASAANYLNTLGIIMHECNLPETKRVRVAAGCLAIAQDHHHAIVILLEHGRYAASFALIRVAFEAYIRGKWLALCASDRQVDEFSDGKEPPKFSTLLSSLEQTEAFNEMAFSKVKSGLWQDLCAYTHTGGLHTQHWISGESIEPRYDDKELLRALTFVEAIGALAVIGITTLAENADAAQKTLKLFDERMAKRI